MAKPNAKGQQTTGQQQAQGQMAHGKKDKRHRAHWAKDAQAAIYPPPPPTTTDVAPTSPTEAFKCGEARCPHCGPAPSQAPPPQQEQHAQAHPPRRWLFHAEAMAQTTLRPRAATPPPPTPIVKPSSTRTRSGGRSTRPPWRPYRRAPRTQAAHRGADGHHYALPCFADTLRDGRRGGGG